MKGDEIKRLVMHGPCFIVAFFTDFLHCVNIILKTNVFFQIFVQESDELRIVVVLIQLVNMRKTMRSFCRERSD
jgi:hypothetical protein